MSQAEDLTAINDYMNRTAGKTAAAKTAKESWTKWYKGLSLWQKTTNDSVLIEAKSRRTAFNAANGTPENIATSEHSMTQAEKDYWLNYPTVNTTGMTAEAAQKAVWTPQKGKEEYVAAASQPILRTGSKGEAVKKWQAIIGVKADGIFGAGTAAATKVWQAKHALKADGVVGIASWTAAAAKTATPDTTVRTSATPITEPVKVTASPLGKVAAKPIKSMQPATTKVTNPVAAAVAAAAATPIATQAAAMVPTSISGLPTWAKAILGILTIGGLLYGVKYSASQKMKAVQ